MASKTKWKELQGTRVAGSWGLEKETDNTKTRLDLGPVPVVPKVPTKTVMMVPPSPKPAVDRAAVEVAGRVERVDLKGTLLLPPSRIIPKVSVEPPPKATPVVPAARAFELEIIEGPGPDSRYRDALRRREEEAFIIMTDFAGSHGVVPVSRIAHLQQTVRRAVMGGASPDAVLGMMNRALVEVGLEAAATCARLDVRTRTIAIASAAGAAPFIVHASQRVSRVRAISGAPLGRANTRFETQVLPFTQNDALLVGSAAWSSTLERVFLAPMDLAMRTLAFALREHRAQPAGGSLVRLSMRR